MSQILASRRVTRPLMAALAIALLIAAAVGVFLTAQRAPASAAVALSPTPPPTVAAKQITRTAGTLRPGTVVPSAHLGLRVFANAQDGFALASVEGGQYPAATVNGGRTWRVDGPVLHVNAAQAPLVVLQVGAADRHRFFAWGGPGGGQVVDVTSDGGKHWWRAILGDVVMAVVAHHGRLVAFAQVAANGSGTKAVTWVYSSRDGGRHWHHDNRLGAGA